MRSFCLLLSAAGLLTIAVGCGKGATTSKDAAKSATAGKTGAAESNEFMGRDIQGAPARSPEPRLKEDAKSAARPRVPTAKTSDPKPSKLAHVSKPKPQFQSGTLTAGSLDDHAKYDEFRDFFSTLLQQPSNRDLPRLSIGRRVEIVVQNDAGESVGNARLVIRRAEEGTDEDPVAEFPTGTDGRGVFLSGYDADNNGTAFEVTATSRDGKRTATQRFELKQGPWTVTLPKAIATLPQKLDLALVVGTTGSMQDELEYLKAEIDGIARAIHARYPDVDQRFALILYRDQSDRYVTRTFDFTGSIEEFRKSLARQSANGGGDTPEAVHLALEQSQQLSWRDGNTARVMFLIGDAPPHPRDEQQTLDSFRALRKRGVTIFPVAASGAKKRAEFLFRMAAFVTRGEFLFLTDHSGVGNPHAKPHAPKYNVERLDQLMIRMIASQLAGRKLLARDIIANERAETNRRNTNAPVPAQRPRQGSSTVTPHDHSTTSSHHTTTHQTTSSHEMSPLWIQTFRWVLAIFAILAIVLLEHLRVNRWRSA